MVEFRLMNASSSQLASETGWKSIPLFLGVVLLSGGFVFDRSIVIWFALLCVVVVFSESVVRKLFATHGRIDSKNKAVLITGCDTGFGRLLASRLSGRGFQVFAGCLTPSGEGWKELSSLPNVHCLKMDVTKAEEVDLAVEEVNQQLNGNGLWAVVNNAGISKGSEVDLTPMAKMEEVLDVNLLGTMRVTKAALHLLRQSRGRIVNVASIAGRLMMPGYVAYSVSKEAVISFSKGLRMEVQKFGVSVVTIEPWMYQTRLSDPSLIGQSIERHWTSATRDSYTDTYARDMKRSTVRLFGTLRNPNVEEVIDAMEDAVVRMPRPLTRYAPGKWYLNACLRVAECLPSVMVDYVLSNWVFSNQAAP